MTHLVGRVPALLALVLAAALALAFGWLTAPGPAVADHSFNNENWDSCGGGNGCIGWKQFAEDSTYVGIAHMDNGGSGCGGAIDVGWGNAVIYWNGTGTVAAFNFPTSDCTGQSYPTVRVVPYTVNNGANGIWATTMNYDQHPSTQAFWGCLNGCSFGSSGNAQKGYDLGEVYFNTYYSPNWTWVAKHELGHTLGLDDHSCGYSGLMDSDACTQVNATAAERDEVDTIHDH